jgi:hypothetical protein
MQRVPLRGLRCGAMFLTDQQQAQVPDCVPMTQRFVVTVRWGEPEHNEPVTYLK